MRDTVSAKGLRVLLQQRPTARGARPSSAFRASELLRQLQIYYQLLTAGESSLACLERLRMTATDHHQLLASYPWATIFVGRRRLYSLAACRQLCILASARL
jgi:hypothetical protein